MGICDESKEHPEFGTEPIIPLPQRLSEIGGSPDALQGL
jgi:hypothetical protein